MKKAKVILTAITVLAVVSGALAFKAQKLQGTLYCTTSVGESCAANENGLIKFSPNSTDPNRFPAFCTLTSESEDCSTITQSRVVIQND